MVPTEAEVRSYWSRLSNWGRWGDDDTMGTLNLVTPEVRRAAAKLVAEGTAVSCARRVEFSEAPDHVYGPPLWQAIRATRLTGHPEEPAAAPVERVAMTFHGRSVTHLDALSHISWEGATYGGRQEWSEGADIAHPLAVTAAADGIVTRGVLLDEAGRRGTPWLAPGEAVLPKHLEACEQRQRVRVQPGDTVLLRTGYGARVAELGPDRGDAEQPGWHAACLPWLYDREVAVATR